MIESVTQTYINSSGVKTAKIIATQQCCHSLEQANSEKKSVSRVDRGRRNPSLSLGIDPQSPAACTQTQS